MTSNQDRPACEGESLGLFFPEGYGRAHLAEIDRAKAICEDCPLADACLNDAMARREKHGIWGGLTPDERMKEARRRRRRAVTEKRCSECGDVKPRSEFYPHSGRASGIGTNCKPCHNRLCTERRRAARKAASA